MLLRKSSRPAARHGAALVEFAIILPLLTLLILGMWELGRMVHVQQMIHNAAREGARQAAAGQKSNTEIQDVVRRYLERAGIPTDNVTVEIQVNNKSDGQTDDANQATRVQQMQVRVTVPFNDFKWVTLQRVTDKQNLVGIAFWHSMKDSDFGAVTDPPVSETNP